MDIVNSFDRRRPSRSTSTRVKGTVEAPSCRVQDPRDCTTSLVSQAGVVDAGGRSQHLFVSLSVSVSLFLSTDSSYFIAADLAKVLSLPSLPRSVQPSTGFEESCSCGEETMALRWTSPRLRTFQCRAALRSRRQPTSFSPFLSLMLPSFGF